jgi:hypothetical protein
MHCALIEIMGPQMTHICLGYQKNRNNVLFFFQTASPLIFRSSIIYVKRTIPLWTLHHILDAAYRFWVLENMYVERYCVWHNNKKMVAIIIHI